MNSAVPVAPPSNAVGDKGWPPNVLMSAWIVQHFPKGYRGYAIDVGASDGISINSTYGMEKQAQWMVLSVEPNPFYHPTLKRYRAFVETCALDAEPGVKRFSSYNDNPEAYSSLRPTPPKGVPLNGPGWTHFDVPVKTLDQLLAKWEFPRLDVLCIDTEGTELDVLRGLDLKRWLPKVMIIESWDEAPQALVALDAHLKPFGYENVKRFVHNNYYVREARDE